MPSIFRQDLLKDKVAFITGGGSGINLRIAERFAEHGARVALLGRSEEKLGQACAGIESAGGTAMGVPADVRDYVAVEAALNQAHERYGEIDVLVCGAAGNFPAPALGMSANGFKAVVDIDLLGTFNTCRAAFDHLRQPGASVMNISATHAFTPVPLQSHVCAAKAGVDMLSKVLALEWGSAGVRVNVISPGPVDETEGIRRLAPTDEVRQKLIKGIPMGRFARKDEIADLALYLASDAASYITGGVFVCDGGQSLSGSGPFMTALGF